MTIILPHIFFSEIFLLSFLSPVRDREKKSGETSLPFGKNQKMAEAVVSFVVEWLGDFVIQEAKFLRVVGDQVEAAGSELRLVKGFLKDADVKQRNDEVVRIWVAEIRDAAYDLEDVIEVYAFKVARREGFKYIMARFACVFKKGVDLHKIGAEIQSITTKLTNLRSSMQTYNIRDIKEIRDDTSSSMQQNLRRTYSHVIEGDVVGLENDVNKVDMHLVNDEDTSCFRVVSIWGMGGSGKTTLAKQVYHHKEVRSKFDCSAWMCISQQCNVREVWEGILVKLLCPTDQGRKEIGRLKDDEIAKKLYLLQHERRCLVVLDDIWRVNTWESLKAAFPLNEKSKSRMVLTTRKKEVALHSDRNGILHQPRPLNEDESWKLLEKMAIAGRGHIDPETYSKMKELGKKMLQPCGGLPLAITVLGGLLAKKDGINEWEMVSKNVLKFIRGQSHEAEYEGAMQVLELSYDDLPYYLKPCFLYLGHYPEDSEIRVIELIRLWTAEGFICQANQRQGSVETMEEVAYNWLNELVERCLVQVGKQGSNRKIKTCHLHDLVRDMCLSKAEEENFLQVICLGEVMVSMETNTKVMGKIRRLAVHVDDNFVPSDEINGHHKSMRSLLYFGRPRWKPECKRLMQSMFKDFKFLRVLKFEEMRGEVELPNDIGKMVHLRYLSLMYSWVRKLPSSVAKLTGLQTLNLVGTNLDPIPNLVREMKQLRHLYFSFQIIGKQHLSSLGDLQTLKINNYDFEWNELADLTSLRKLSLRLSRPLKNMEQLNSTSSTLSRIQSVSVDNYPLRDDNSAEVMQIVLRCPHISKLRLLYSTLELPQDPQYYPRLTKLFLFHCHLKGDQMAVLEKLPNLTKVDLRFVTFEENRKSLVCSKGGFPRLQVLSLFEIQLDDWKVEEGAMPNLRELAIDHCTRRLPEGLRYINTLQKIEIIGMRRADCSRLQEGGEDLYIVQHVPSLVFGDMEEDDE